MLPNANRMSCSNKDPKFTQSRSLEVKIVRLGEKNEMEELSALISNSSIEELNRILLAKLDRKLDCMTFWNYLLLGFDVSNLTDREKRFACVKCLLNGLQKIELTYKQTFDLISRLCQDLNTFPVDQLVEMVEYCCDGIRTGDPKCVGWKDLLPEILKSLTTNHHVITVNSVPMTGDEYQETIIKNLYTMRWSDQILIPLADMFKELKLSSSEIVIVLNKFASSFETLSPDTLPALAYQLFAMSQTALHIMIPILALDKYFYRFYYKKLFAEMDSNTTDIDSIDAYSDDELRESEETILHHLDYCTQYKINETQMGNILKNFITLPDVILTPFIISAILAMSIGNREPNMRLSTSILLPLLRTIIYHNEQEKQFSNYSVWCRDSLYCKQANLDQIFTVLINQNKDGRETVTPGLVNLAFTLLRHRNNREVQELAIKFLIKFVKKRFIFGQGIVKKLTEWMIVEQDRNQYAECLNILSVTETFTISECSKSINYVLNYLLWISSEQSMRMMTFLLPILKISPVIRESLIDILRKAMGSSDADLRKMAVYGLCMILKQLNYSNCQRTQFNSAVSFTQHTISGYSVMSQMPGPGNRSNSQHHFDMLTLEVIGLLRGCLQQLVELKIILYENLQRAVELNVKLVPHVLQFIDWHFRSYFTYKSTKKDEIDILSFNDVDFQIQFEKLVEAKDNQSNNIYIYDNLGRLLILLSHCLLIFENFKTEYNVKEISRLIQFSIDKVSADNLDKTMPDGNVTLLENEIFAQKLNFIEGLMGYCVLNSTVNSNEIQHLWPLFKTHDKLRDDFKSFITKRTYKKSKTASHDESSISTSCWFINGQSASKPSMQYTNIWDLVIIERLLSLFHLDSVPFTSSTNCSFLKNKTSFLRYVLTVTGNKIEQLRSEPEYKQLAHSKRLLKYLTDITKIIYEGCLQRLSQYCHEHDVDTALLAVECFHQCLKTANQIYKTKFVDVFWRGYDIQSNTRNKEDSISVMQTFIDAFMKEQQISEENLSTSKSKNANETNLFDSGRMAIVQNLFNCLDILYDYQLFDDPITTESYSWLLQFCQTYSLKDTSLAIVHKLLFKQRLKTHSGAFYQIIPLHLAKVWSFINDDIENENGNQSHIKLKSITEFSAESCLHYLYETLQQQLNNVDYFITKANNLSYNRQLIDGEQKDSCATKLQALERSICSQLVHLSQTFKNISNVCLPLGPSMDGLIKLLTQHYITLRNFAKHYLNCITSGLRISLHGSKFDLLLKIVGKPMATNIYTLITYIEGNILDDTVAKETKKVSNKAEKAKILRETKHVPKLVYCIEKFNREVISLAKRSNDKITNYLHFGTVRDFRIKSSDLKAAIEKSLEQSDSEDDEAEEENHSKSSKKLKKKDVKNSESKNANEEDNLEDNECVNENNNASDGEKENDESQQSSSSMNLRISDTTSDRSEMDNDSTMSKHKNLKRQVLKESIETVNYMENSRKKKSKSDSKRQRRGNEEKATLPNESNAETRTQFLRNVAKINQEVVRKRRLRESNECKNPDVAASEEPPPMTKRLRSQYKQK